MHDVTSLPDATLFIKKESNIRIPVLLNLSNVLQNWLSALQMLHNLENTWVLI